MKGVVFTEFMELVEARMGLDMLDRIIEEAQLPNGGAYTSVGTYDHAELVRMVVALSKATGLPRAALVHLFGEHLFDRFSVGFPAMFADSRDAFDFLSRVDEVIHVEVRKLYPDAELPHLPCERIGQNEMLMHYSSPRGFADLAQGLIDGCIKYYKRPIKVTRTDLEKEGDLYRTRFHMVAESA